MKNKFLFLVVFFSMFDLVVLLTTGAIPEWLVIIQIVVVVLRGED